MGRSRSYQIYSTWLIDRLVNAAKIIYLDEVGFQVSARLNWGRAIVREAARTIEKKSMIHFEALAANGNAESLRQFLHGL